MSYRLAAIAAVVFPLPLAAADVAPEGSVKVYQSVLKSTVWIIIDRPEGTVSGSGSLIDRRRQLVLTNYHVVGEARRARVMFPAFREGRVIAEREYYKRRVNEDGITGTVVARDRQADM